MPLVAHNSLKTILKYILYKRLLQTLSPYDNNV